MVLPLIFIKCEKAKFVCQRVTNSSNVAQTSVVSAPNISSDSPSVQETSGFYGYSNSNVHQISEAFSKYFPKSILFYNCVWWAQVGGIDIKWVLFSLLCRLLSLRCVVVFVHICVFVHVLYLPSVCYCPVWSGLSALSHTHTAYLPVSLPWKPSCMSVNSSHSAADCVVFMVSNFTWKCFKVATQIFRLWDNLIL